MDPITQQTVLAAAGAAGGDKVYVDDVFSTTLYSGTGSTRDLNTGIDNTDKSLIWFKVRDDTNGHVLVDTERGTDKQLHSNDSDAQITRTDVQAFTDTGVTLGNHTGWVNSGSGSPYVAWNFKAAPGFFDVVTYTGNSTAGRQIPHSLGSVPGMIIVKNLTLNTGVTSRQSWTVYHRSANGFLSLNSTDAENTSDLRSKFGDGTNPVAPTSSVFTVGADYSVNNSSHNYVAYVFAHDNAKFGTNGNESIIKCGGYAGSSSELDVNVGFEPQWVLIKKATGNLGWRMLDNMRGINTGIGDDYFLSAHSVDEEQGQDMVDLTATGFRVKNNSNVNGSGHDFIYMAIRRPNKPPTAATEVFAVDTGNSSSTTPCWDSGFPVDFAIMTYPTTTYPKQVATRLMGSKHLTANATNGESNDSDFTWDSNVGWGKNWNHNTYSWMFKRAPGFFDVVTYKGSGSATTINHNLGVAPQMMWIKNRDDNESWSVYHKDKGADKTMWLNDDGAGITSDRFNNTAPTASVFSVKTSNATNTNGDDFTAYLFATLPGISKVGSYSGNTGNAVNVDCGFTNGARFVLIKRTDSTGDWYVWDTLRGIVSGDDPLFVLNSTAAQHTDLDFIDPLSSGFTVTSSAPAALNASGGTYLFLAIA